MLREVCERIPSLAMLPPAQLPISTLVYLNNDSLSSHLARRDTFPDVTASRKKYSVGSRETVVKDSLWLIHPGFRPIIANLSLTKMY